MIMLRAKLKKVFLQCYYGEKVEETKARYTRANGLSSSVLEWETEVEGGIDYVTKVLLFR